MPQNNGLKVTNNNGKTFGKNVRFNLDTRVWKYKHVGHRSIGKEDVQTDG